MDKRSNCGISVVAYQPLQAPSNEEGWIMAPYPLALMVAASGTYLIDKFGIGAGPLETPKVFYNQPVCLVSDGNSIIDFRALIIGNFAVGLDEIKTLNIDRTIDLAQFIESGPDCDQRLEKWVYLWEKDRARSQEV